MLPHTLTTLIISPKKKHESLHWHVENMQNVLITVHNVALQQGRCEKFRVGVNKLTFTDHSLLNPKDPC